MATKLTPPKIAGHATSKNQMRHLPVRELEGMLGQPDHQRNSDKIVKHETPEMIEAFEYYYSLGHKRSTEKVAQYFKKDQTTIKRWSVSFDWQTRIQDRNQKVKQRVEEISVEQIAREKASYRKIARATVKEFEKQLKQKMLLGKVSVSDFERLVKLDLLLMGESTERIEYIQKFLVVVTAVIDKVVEDQNLRTKIYDALSEINMN